MGKVAIPAILSLGALLVGALHHRGRVLDERKKRSVKLEAVFSAGEGKAGKPLPVKFVLRNVGKDPVRVVTRGDVHGGAKFSVHVRAADGGWWRRWDSVFVSRETVAPADFRMLRPHESVEVRDGVFEEWSFPAGRFRLVAHYRFEPRATFGPPLDALIGECVPRELISEFDVEVRP